MLLLSILLLLLVCNAFGLARTARTSVIRKSAFTLRSGGISSGEELAVAPLQEILMRIDCNDVSPDDFTDMLFELGVSSVSIEIETEKDVLNDEQNWAQLGKATSWDTALVRAHVPRTFDSDQLLNIMKSSGMDFDLQKIESIDESKDWVSEVQRNWTPERVTDDLSIRFPWHTDDDVDTQSHLTLEAGAAFGTGGHQTTRLCCQWLEKQLRVNGGQIASILDYGCGSAILALVALHYGCKQADGTDIDIDSLYAARRNAINNGYSDQLNLFVAYEVDDDSTTMKHNPLKGSGSGTEEKFKDVTELQGRTYPLVVANILAPILISLADDMFTKTQGGGGKVALSGVIEKQAQSVVDAYKKAGFSDVKVEQTMDEWVLITGSRD